MNATSRAVSLAAVYVGKNNIVQIDVRNQTNPYIQVVFERALDPYVRKMITEQARPFHVRFVDRPLNKMITK